MFTSLLNHLGDWEHFLTSPLWLAMTAFQIWMLLHALRHREWVWALFIFVGWGIAALWYYFQVYQGSASTMSGFELPGAQSRARIKELEAKIHHVDNAYHHFQLGDVYFQKGKLAQAEHCYRAALQRDATDIDTRAHLGQCLLRMKRPAEARPLLDAVCRENYKHDFGYSLMAYAETLMALNETDAALKIWEHVVENHSYPRAKVQLAELYLARQQYDLARDQLKDVVNDDLHAPAFQRKRDRVWIRRAKRLRHQLPT
jgi:tetratricopeptide (TPR) repeat protein